jgi:hypothetical protein
MPAASMIGQHLSMSVFCGDASIITWEHIR